MPIKKKASPKSSQPQLPADYKPVYEAVRECKGVKFPDGTYRNVQPGQPVPGAENWNNPYLWEKRGWIKRIDGEITPFGSGGKYEPPRAVTNKDLERQEKEMREWAANGAPDHEGFGTGEIGPGKGQVPATRAPSEAELEKIVKDRLKNPAKEPDPKRVANLQRLGKKKLLEMAVAKGLTINASGSAKERAKNEPEVSAKQLAKALAIDL